VYRVAELDAPTRARLTEALYPIYSESFVGYDADVFRGSILFRSEDAELGLYYGPEGELAGFTSVEVTWVEAGGITHAVLNAGTYVSRRYAGSGGGTTTVRFGLNFALRFKLRHPLTPLWYVPELTNPAPYRLLARSFPVVFPRPDYTTPGRVEALARAVVEQRGMISREGQPWVARFQHAARGVRAERFEVSTRLRDDPLVHFYVSLNPDFADGDDLVACIPLDLLNVIGAAMPPLRRVLRAWRRPKPGMRSRARA
jgi:hypothetical protein